MMLSVRRTLAARIARNGIQTRSIVIGSDQANWNSVVLTVPQAEEWMIERFGKYSRTAQPVTPTPTQTLTSASTRGQRNRRSGTEHLA